MVCAVFAGNPHLPYGRNGLKLLRLSSLMLTFQFVLFALAQNPGVIIGTSILQLFSTPIILVASKMLILELAPDKLKSSSQLIALSIFTGGSSMLMPATAGFFSEHIGFNLTLICVALLGICSFLLTSPLSKMSS